jgi:hypothetical protein
MIKVKDHEYSLEADIYFIVKNPMGLEFLLTGFCSPGFPCRHPEIFLGFQDNLAFLYSQALGYARYNLFFRPSSAARSIN